MVIGIDLGIEKDKFAVSKVHNGKLIDYDSCDGFVAVRRFVNMPKTNIGVLNCVMEYPNAPYISSERELKKGSGRLIAAMCIGKLLFLGDIIEHELTQRGVKVLKVKPKKGTTKLPEAQFRAMFNWIGPLPSQDEMDAAVLAFLHENDPQFLLMK